MNNLKPANVDDYDDSVPIDFIDNPLPDNPLCSGFGEYHTDKPTSPTPKPYKTITLNNVLRMVEHPTSVAKEEAQWFIPSRLLTRNAEKQRADGAFFAVWGDIDRPTELAAIKAVLANLFCFYLIYSSRGATPKPYQKDEKGKSKGGKRWRVVIPLATPATATEWEQIAEIINDKFEQAGIVPDRASERINQICYLPNKGEFYQFHIERNLDPLNWKTALAAELNEKQHQAEQRQAAINAQRERSRQKAIARMQTGETSPINAYNAEYPLEQSFGVYGYKRVGHKRLSPNSESGNPGVTIKGDKWISKHSSDSAIGQPCTGGGTWGDSFDLFVHYEHGGDRKAATIAAGDMFTVNGKTISKNNQQEYAKQNSAANDFSHSECVNNTVTTQEQAKTAHQEPPTQAKDTSQPQSKQEPPQFQLVSIKSLIDNPIPIRWTIKGFLEKSGMNLISGPYGSGKSFVAFDMGFCVAAGIDWNGNKVIQSPVIILAGEGHSGIADRFAALELKYGVSCPGNLYVSKIPARLTDGVNANWVSKAVNQICPDAGLIIIDTLNRNFGGLDENSTKDMTLFINNVDNIFRVTSKTSIVVHHTGHAETNRARGNSSLPGACEGEFIVKGQDGGLILICEKQKNAAKAVPLQFKFKRIEIPGRTDEGEPVASLVLEWNGEATSDIKRIRLSGRDDLILTSLWEAITEHGIEPNAEIKEKFGGFDSLESKHKKVVHIDYWRARAYPVIDAESADGKIKAFKRTRDKLVDVGKVRYWNDYWWHL